MFDFFHLSQFICAQCFWICIKTFSFLMNDNRATWDFDLGYWTKLIEWTRAKRYANGDWLKIFKKRKSAQGKDFPDNGSFIGLN